eukprot:scaffold3946_cov118-Isochrysis_galbana.AAC.4
MPCCRWRQKIVSVIGGGGQRSATLGPADRFAGGWYGWRLRRAAQSTADMGGRWHDVATDCVGAGATASEDFSSALSIAARHLIHMKSYLEKAQRTIWGGRRANSYLK